MNRRAFITSMVGGIATATAVRTFPFRVYSFPTDIKVAKDIDIRDIQSITYSTDNGHTWIPISVTLYNHNPRLQSRITNLRSFSESGDLVGEVIEYGNYPHLRWSSVSRPIPDGLKAGKGIRRWTQQQET